MKKILIAAVASWILGLGHANAQTGDVLITAVPVGNGVELVFELLNDGGVAAVQYEVHLPRSLAHANIDTSNCIGSYSGLQLAGCHLTEENVLRVGIINNGLREMATGEIGRVHISGDLAAENIRISNAVLIGKSGSEQKIEALSDFSQIPPRSGVGLGKREK